MLFLREIRGDWGGVEQVVEEEEEEEEERDRVRDDEAEEFLKKWKTCPSSEFNLGMGVVPFNTRASSYL